METIKFLGTLVSHACPTWASLPSQQTSAKISSIAQETLKDLGQALALVGGCTFLFFYPIDAIATLSGGALIYYFILKEECDALFEKIFGKPQPPDADNSSDPGLLSRIFSSPPFVPGQPPRLRNSGSTCFMNAGLQAFLNDPVLKEGLKLSTPLSTKKYEDQKYQDLAILCSYLHNEERAVALSHAKTPLRQQGSLIPSILSLFAQEDFSELRSYLLRHLPTFQISFEVLVDKIRKKEPFDPDILFGYKNSQQEILDFFLSTPDMKRLILAAKNKEKEKKEAFIALGEILEKCEMYEQGTDFPKDVICLHSLRPLLPHRCTHGQQDAIDFVTALINQIVESGISCPYFFPLTHEKHYSRADIEEAVEKVALESRGTRDPSPMTPGGILGTTDPTFQFIVTPQPQDNPNGQILLDRLLGWHLPSDATEPCVFLGDDNQPHLYKLSQEKMTLPQLPEKFILSLNRILQGGRKNDAPVEIPQQLEIQGQRYQMQSAVRHSGGSWGGHYVSLVRKIHHEEPIWWVCDDASIYKACDANIKSFLNKGSFYFFEKIS